jgi:superfamily II DNA or RNA helicase
MKFEPRDYQQEFVRRTQAALIEYDRVLGVAPTGSGKTVMAGELCKRFRQRILFLADAKELVNQAADKIGAYLGEICGVEMAQEAVDPADDHRVVVATSQSIARRLEKYDPDHFGYIIIDEAHRNTLGQLPQRVLSYFGDAQVVGITATPFRTDKKNLAHFYQAISHEVKLIDLINAGYLSKITVKTVPCGVSLKDVRVTAGDYNDKDLAEALNPFLLELAKLLKRHAADRKTVVFLPLIATSQAFRDACNSIDLPAVHVDGNDRTALEDFKAGRAQVICNAQLLTTGWDQPDVDCVFMLRPTKSFVMYSQCIGRGTRTFPGKQDLLILDPMFLAEKNNLIRPARLVAKDEAEAEAVQKKLDLSDDEGDLLEITEAERDLRIETMRKNIAANARRELKTMDYIEFALTLDEEEIAEYEPSMKWESAPISDKQRAMLERSGFDISRVTTKGLACKILDVVFRRIDQKLATPKQLKWMLKLNVPDAQSKTFEEAGDILNNRFGKKST